MNEAHIMFIFVLIGKFYWRLAILKQMHFYDTFKGDLRSFSENLDFQLY